MSFLYPFLAEGENDLEAVVEDVRSRRSRRRRRSHELRAQTLTENRDELQRRGRAARRARCGRLPARARQWRLGHRCDGRRRRLPRPPDPCWRPRRALDLTEDPAILTAIANDIGTEAIFARQVIAHGRDGDVTARDLDERRLGERDRGAGGGARRGLRTIALVGYDGGRVAADGWPTTWS